MYRSVISWIGKMILAISESGILKAKITLLDDCIKRAEQWKIELKNELQSTVDEFELTLEILNRYLTFNNKSIINLPMLFKYEARVLMYLIIGGLVLDMIISVALGKRLFWFIPDLWAISLSVMLAILIAVITHGLLGIWFSIEKLLRRIRILRRLVKIFGTLSLLLLIPMILGRILIIPPEIASVSLGLTGIVLPITIGAASSLRKSYLISYKHPTDKINDLKKSIQLLEDQIITWKEDRKSTEAKLSSDTDEIAA